jgi:hypothetical protein
MLSPPPKIGPRAKLAYRVSIERKLAKDQAKVLILLAAYADGGVSSPSARELTARLAGGDLPKGPRDPAVRQLDWHLGQLARRGLVTVMRRPQARSIYALHLGASRKAAA